MCRLNPQIPLKQQEKAAVNEPVTLRPHLKQSKTNNHTYSQTKHLQQQQTPSFSLQTHFHSVIITSFRSLPIYHAAIQAYT